MCFFLLGFFVGTVTSFVDAISLDFGLSVIFANDGRLLIWANNWPFTSSHSIFFAEGRPNLLQIIYKDERNSILNYKTWGLKYVQISLWYTF